MFDFFDEVIEFLNQIVANGNDISNFIDTVISSSSDAVLFVGRFSGSFPVTFGWMLPAALVLIIFDYVRGR